MVPAMSDEEFDEAVGVALESIPERLASKIDNVAVFVEDVYTPEPWEDPETTLLGLYEGIPLTERGEAPGRCPTASRSTRSRF